MKTVFFIVYMYVSHNGIPQAFVDQDEPFTTHQECVNIMNTRIPTYRQALEAMKVDYRTLYVSCAEFHDK